MFNDRRTQKIYSEIIESDAYQVCREVKTILQRLVVTSGIDPDQCFDIRVILSELLQNAIKHGNRCDINKKIRVDVWLQENSRMLGITIKDQGCGFSPASIIDSRKNTTDDNPMNMDESGRGLFIVQNLCDFVEFNTAGNSVTIHKRL